MSQGAPSVSTAYVLAAGLGTRLRPLTNERPKPLVEVCGTPLVVLALRLLARAGVTRVAMNSHWLHPQLPDRLGTTHAGMALTFTHEPEVLGTGGGLLGLRAALPPRPGEKVLVLNADALIDLDVASLCAADRPDALATLVLQESPDVEAYGAIGTDAEDRIVSFAGRIEPLGPEARRRMFCGVHLVDPAAFDVLPSVVLGPGNVASGKASGINDDGYPQHLRVGRRLYGHDHRGVFCDVGTPERLLEANLALLAGAWSCRHLHPFEGLEERPGRVFVHPRARVASAARLRGPLLIDEGAEVEAYADVGPLVVVGRGCRVTSEARLAACVLQAGAVVRDALSDAVASISHRLRVDASIGQRLWEWARLGAG